MKSNLSNPDRLIRALIFVIAAVLYFTGTLPGTLGLVLLIVGAILLITSFINFCPINAAFGWSSRKQ